MRCETTQCDVQNRAVHANKGVGGRALFFDLVNILVVAVLLSASGGCQSNLTARRLAAKNPLAKNVAKTPVHMVDVWQTYAQTNPAGKPMRGIAGRIHFYSDGMKKQSVKVDGDLSVFVFDAGETDPTRSKPLKVYKFPAETMSKHYAFKKPLGHGYDFFLPFDELGGQEKTLCVMARFDDRLEGGLIVAQPVNTILKGTKRESVETSFQQFLATHSILGKAGEKQADQTETVREPAVPESQNHPVTTITLNDRMTRRLQRSADSVPSRREIPVSSATESSGSADTAENASSESIQHANWIR